MTTLDGTVDLARDRELVERCQMGDEGAFAELYDRYHRRLLRFCLRRLHSQDDAEEAVQEAFTRAWRALPHFGGERRFYPWLTVIAGNVCTDMLRRRARVVPMDEMPRRSVDLDGPEVDEQLLRQVDLAMATEAFAHLSARHQRVLRLRENTEWSAQRIAEFEGVAVPAVDTLLWRARQAFKREFAMLSDASGLAGFLGFGLAALRRGAGRVWMRASSFLPTPMRGPGAIAATVAITGAAIAGGSVALVGTGSPPHHASASSEHATNVARASSSATTGSRVTTGTTGSTQATKAPGKAASSTGTHHGTAASGVSTGGSQSSPGTQGSLASVSSGGSTLGELSGTAVVLPGETSPHSVTTLGNVISRVGGLITGGSPSVSTPATSGHTAVSTVTGTLGKVVGSVGSAVSSLGTTTGTGTSGSSGSGSTGTVTGTLKTATSLPVSVTPTTMPTTTPTTTPSSTGSSSSGSSGSGSSGTSSSGSGSGLGSVLSNLGL